MNHYPPVRYPVTSHTTTPPDEPEPPDLSEAVPCFCGCEPALDDNGKGPESACWLVCPSCGHQGPKGLLVNFAVNAWNDSVLEESERLKAEGQKQAAEHNEAWMDTVMPVIKDLAATGKEFTAENARRLCLAFEIAPPKSPNAWGAAFSAAAKQGLIVRCGYAKNHLASAHARVVAIWKGAQC